MKMFKWWSFLFISLILFSPWTISADMGPKPGIDIFVNNPPEEDYYLDLLTQSNHFNNTIDTKEYEPDMVNQLLAFTAEGWYPAHLTNAVGPMWGSLEGVSDNGKMLHNFHYRVPESFKIITVTESGKVQISEIYTRKSLKTTLYYDYKTNTIQSRPVFLAYLFQFLSTFLPTLLIEGLILKGFKFDLKLNFKVFFIVNFLTQLFLTSTLGQILIIHGTFDLLFFQFPIEIIILIVEAAAYAFLLKGRSKGKRISYAIWANLASWIIGIIIMFMQFGFITMLT